MGQTVGIVSANLGKFDPDIQRSKGDFYMITEREYPLRSGAMTPRLQARIVKTHTWDFAPGYDYYLWVDASCVLSPDASEWFMKQLGDADMAVFRHNKRQTVGEEADYLKHRLDIGCPYITPRYAHEDIDGQMAVVRPKDRLFATTAFICKDSPRVRAMMREWWYHISRFHSIDQLSLPHVLNQSDCTYRVIDQDYLKSPYLHYARGRV